MATCPTTRSTSVAAELESLGYGALWSSGRFDPGLSPHFERLLASTDHVAVASGIVSIWAGAPEDVGPAVAALEDRFPGRFLLGVGTSHGPIVADYSRPYSKMVGYLDALDALATPVPPERRVLAALGPRMLRAGRRPHRRRPSLLRPGRAHRPGPRHPRPRPAPGTRGGGRPRGRPGPGPGAGPRLRQHLPRTCPTTRRTCAPSALATTTSAGAGATA